MKKVLVISSFIFSALLADNSLGTILYNPILKPHQEKSYSKNIENPPKAKSQYSKRKFKKDDHRYDKRYNNFDYETHGYYNDDGYYYGYYDRSGYFYNNIFFTYNSQYTYYDRDHFRGHFRPNYHHHRVYEYHVVNNWNRVHCYREPNQIVYGYYEDRPSYSTSYRSEYYSSPRYYTNERHYSRDNARMHTNRDNIYQRDNIHQRENHYRDNTHHRYNQNRNNNYNDRNHRDRNRHRSDTRMRTRSSSHSSITNVHGDSRYGNKSNHRSSGSHMQLSR